MRVLITGGLGVIGSCLVRRYLRDGWKVTVLDACEKDRNRWTLKQLRREWDSKNLEAVKGRIEKLGERALAKILGNSDLVVHAAASTGIPHSALDPDDDWKSNVDATRQLVETCRKNRLRPPTILFSSVKPYDLSKTHIVEGDTRYEVSSQDHCTEDFPLLPDEPYAASKMAQSALGVAYARSFDLPITVLRFSNLYGPGACHGPRHGWLTWFCIAAALGRKVSINGNGKQLRDMLYVDDIYTAVTLAHEFINTTAGHVFNVGGGPKNCISIIEAATALGLEYQMVPNRRSEDLAFVTNHTRFSRVTGWEPKTAVADGTIEVRTWARDNAKELSKLYAGM